MQRRSHRFMKTLCLPVRGRRDFVGELSSSLRGERENPFISEDCLNQQTPSK